MIIHQFDFKPYSLPLRTPFNNAQEPFEFRRGFLVFLHSNAGYTGIGECAPLPGFSPETYHDTKNALQSLQRSFRPVKVDFIPGEYGINLPEFLCQEYSTIRFAFESAIYDLIGQIQGKPVRKIFTPDAPNKIRVNATIGIASVKKTIEKSKQLASKGFSVIKLKIGRTDFGDDLEVVQSVLEALPESIRLRLDANQSWSLDATIKNVKHLTDNRIEYLEQPIPAGRPGRLKQIQEASPVPIAADEELQGKNVIPFLLEMKSVQYLILKPAILGFSSSIETIQKAEQAGVSVVLTSSLDSVVGRTTVAHLAAGFLPNEVHGLATGNLFKFDVTKICPQVIEGKLLLPTRNGLGIAVDSEQSFE